MKALTSLLLPVILLTGCSSSPTISPGGVNTPPPDINAWLKPRSEKPDSLSETRWKMLTDAGKTLGFRGGKAQRSWELIQALNARESTLNALYDFRPLISPEGWLPPVIDEAQDVAHITPDQIRTSSRVWTIIRPERFVSNPPGWRDWLLRGLSTTATPGTEGSVVPEDSVQRKVWETALRQGWQEGRQNADLTLEANQKTLTRDYTRFMINPETRVIAVDLNNVAGDKTPAGRLKTGIMYLLAGQIAGGDFTLPQYRDEVLKQLPREYHEIALKRINQLDQEVKTKVYDELHNARGIDFIWENLDTQEREQRKFAIRTVLSTQYLRDYPESVLKSANTLWLLRYKPEDIPVLRDNFNVPEFMLKRFLKMPEGPAPDGSGVPVLGVFRVKSGTLARILKFTVGPLELWALNSSPKDSALRKTLTNKLGSVRARKILAENFPRGSATSLIEHRAGQHNSDNVIEELASELIRKQGYNL